MIYNKFLFLLLFSPIITTSFITSTLVSAADSGGTSQAAQSAKEATEQKLKTNITTLKTLDSGVMPEVTTHCNTTNTISTIPKNPSKNTSSYKCNVNDGSGMVKQYDFTNGMINLKEWESNVKLHLLIGAHFDDKRVLLSETGFKPSFVGKDDKHYNIAISGDLEKAQLNLDFAKEECLSKLDDNLFDSIIFDAQTWKFILHSTYNESTKEINYNILNAILNQYYRILKPGGLLFFEGKKTFASHSRFDIEEEKALKGFYDNIEKNFKSLKFKSITHRDYTKDLLDEKKGVKLPYKEKNKGKLGDIKYYPIDTNFSISEYYVLEK
ncbi:MAG: hypothetical protein HQK51_13895 [Oligoflexia bacterium]|nr:hypothetical protein [Oligoflexia bacterium]